MSIPPPNREGANLRRAFRCPVPETCQQATLLVNGAEIPVQLLDESATGFAVRVARPPGVKAKDVVGLRSSAGCFEVRVACVNAERRTDADGDSAGGQAAGCRIGLERLKELVLAETREGWFRRFGLASLKRSGVALAATACLLALAVGVGGLFVGVLLWRSGPSPVTDASASKRQSEVPSALDWIVGRQADAEGVEGRPTRQSPTASQGESGVARSSPPPSRETGDQRQGIRNTIRWLPGATAFVLSDVVRELDLDETQQEQIRGIVDANQRAIRQIGGQEVGNRQEYAERRAALLEQGRRQALEILTPEQRARWQALQD